MASLFGDNKKKKDVTLCVCTPRKIGTSSPLAKLDFSQELFTRFRFLWISGYTFKHYKAGLDTTASPKWPFSGSTHCGMPMGGGQICHLGARFHWHYVRLTLAFWMPSVPFSLHGVRGSPIAAFLRGLASASQPMKRRITYSLMIEGSVTLMY